MEVELVTEEGLLEEDNFGVDDNNTDYSNFEAERCGICMDIVIDRGVLDCCQHWFCFTCIDNWATITNLCPLCQNEFQLITCVPVYDTIGSNNADEDLESRDDDWCIEGKNNTLSFPSYYIDENAVVCLDGDDCKVRSMSESMEEYSNLDTSIACDSCDVWYHAFCVGFDPEATCENSWLCPRCTVNLMPQKSDEVLVLRPSNQHDPENSSGECFVDAAFSGRLMISVADAGETAVVVSMLEGKQGTEEQNQKISGLDVCKDPKIDTIETATVKENNGAEKPTLEALFQVSESVADAGEKAAIEGIEGTEEGRRKFFSSFSVSKDLKTDTSMLSSFANNHKLETPSNENISIEPLSMAEELELSLSQGTSFTSPSNSLLSTELFVDKARSTPSVSDGFGTSSNKLFCQLYNNESLESGLDLHLGLSVSPSLSVDNANNKLAEDQVAVGVQLKNNLGECPLPADETIIDKNKNIDGISGAKRKHRDWRGAEDGEIKAKIGTKVLSKKVNADRNNQLVHSRNQADECVSEDPQKSPSLIAVSKDRKLRGKSERKNVTTSIMDIVQGTERRPKGFPQASLAETSSGKRENAAGLRVKKIMRRPTEDKESSILVQKLRKEIRDAVRNKTSRELGDNLFDPKLLAAFRAAVAGPIAETKKSLPVDLKAKKSLLQKGKVRESLTKKIYGIGGRRRRAWNRDCEIEFWKYRCSKFSRPEKIETLNSVLNMLRKSSESTEINQGNEKAASNSILSRLYLADSSVFPRKDDIKPLSTLKAVGTSGQNKEVSSTEKAFTQSLGTDFSNIPCMNPIPLQIKTPSIYSEVTKRTFPMVKGEASSCKLHSNKCSEGPTISKLGGSKSNSQKEIVGKSDENKADKRKWAQQFLARKAAVTGKDASQEQEDTAVLKGTHTLLAQLPRDMLPVLATSRHNKIPTSIRQAQLHRLTEHFLSKANMPVNRRTAEIELAVADAVNIEKEVADRSNSKLVYVNLCSQELLHRSATISSGRATKSNPNPTSEVPTDRSVEATDDRSSCLEVDEALRNAGLLSDSPPNSPHHQMEEIEEVNTSKTLEQEGPDNVFEMDSQPELEIYGDFEYDLEDEDFIGASALKLSELQSGEPKLKVVFSTIDSDRSNGAQDFEDREEPAIVEEPEGPSTLLESLTNTSSGRSHVDDKTVNCDPQSSSLDGGEELSLAECEELYGPDKEPLMKKFPERASMKPYEPKNSEDNGSNHTVKASDPDRETCTENLANTTVVRHSSGGEDEPSQSQKNTSRKEKMHKMDIRKQSDGCNSSVHKKVEAYIKEHIRPLCKSGVITVEQYRWAVGKTNDKIMKYHSKDTNANFLIKEGEKVKKLAEQYVEAAQRTE